jgi:hypothetical protein
VVDAGAALRALGYPGKAARTTISPSPWRLAARPVAAPPPARALAPRPGLLRALVALAREDTVAAGALLAGLLPAQGAILGADISYDLTVRGFGTFAVTVREGSARVQRIGRRRPRREAAFHLASDPLVLAELLAGEQRRIRRFGRSAVKVNGRRKRVRALAPLAAAELTLAELVRAGARLEPSLVYRALPFAVAPEWTRGHVFTVAQEIVEFGPRAWYVTARDGVPLDVVEHVSGAAADATVTMTRAAFERLLRGEPAAAGDLPTVRGNRTAVATLKRWTELAAAAE